MDWNNGYAASYHASLVDPDTWADGVKIDLAGGNINRTDTGLRHSADIECHDYSYGSDRWIRVWMNAEQAGSNATEPLFTGLVSAPERDIDGFIVETPLQCYSVLKPAQDILMPIGWYAAKGFIGADMVKQLLSVTPAPISIEGISPRLAQHIIAENNENRLTMADKILTAIGWRLKIDGYGAITICPMPDSESALFSGEVNDQIEPQVKVKDDWFSCPNVFRASTDEASAVAYDYDTASPLSITNRGREVWAEESSVKLSEGESLQTYAERRLREEQLHSSTVFYDRSFAPGILPTDRIRLHYPAHNLSGTFIVTSQKISLDHSATTSEEVRAE